MQTLSQSSNTQRKNEPLTSSPVAL